MDPALASLAGAAGAALVQAMTRDTWEATKARFARVFSRHRSDDEHDMTRQLEVTEQRLRAISGPIEPALAEERERWAVLLAGFLAAHAEAAPELHDAVLAVGHLAARDSFTVAQEVTAGRDAYASGRDQYVSRPADDDPGPPRGDDDER